MVVDLEVDYAFSKEELFHVELLEFVTPVSSHLFALEPRRIQIQIIMLD